MRSPSIDWLHAKLEKKIKLTESFSEINGLENIIKGCRLKPYDYIFEKKDNRIILHKWWIDEFGNSLIIKERKKVDIIHNDLRLDLKKIISTDLYYGLSLKKIIKMSKLAYLIAGKDEDLYEDCYLLTFVGIDNYFRSYMFMYGDWQQVSPLIMGLNNLKKLSNNLNIKSFKKIDKKENNLPCVINGMWLFSLPVNNEDFLNLLKKEYEIIFSLIKTESL